MSDPAPHGSSAVADFEGYGFAVDVDGVSVYCCLSDEALTRWQSSLECADRTFRRMRRYGSHILAAHLSHQGARAGERWVARIDGRSVELVRAG